MPARPMTVPMIRPSHARAGGRARAPRRARTPRRSAPGSRGRRAVTPGICSDAEADGADGQHAHGDLHRALALGDVVVGAREADLGVLLLARRRVRGDVVRGARWPPSSSRASAHGLAVEGPEDHPERVDGGHERAEVAEHAEDDVPAAALELQRDDLVLGEQAGERRDTPASARPPTMNAAVGERHRLAEAAHLVEVLRAGHRGDDRAGGHEEQRLEERVRDQVEHARGVGGARDGHDHVADLRHRRVGDDALEVGDDEADRRRDQQRQRSR